MIFVKASLALSLYAYVASAQGCASVLLPKYKPPSVAPGYAAQLVATGLKKPRSIEFDAAGALLVIDSGVGVARITFKDNGGTCLQVEKTAMVVNDPALNHGLALSADGRTLYASSVANVFAWNYDPQAGTVSGQPRTVINNMSNNDQTTRTLLMSKKKPGTLIVSRGSSENFDIDALDINSGLSQIKAFDLTNLTGLGAYDFETSGRRLGWGLRNSVGVAEHPVTGGIFSVENSIDGITRNGIDIRQNNPGEELNYHGFLNDTTTNQGGNYGYPKCFAVWDPSIPDSNGLTVGSQFSIVQNTTLNDTTCFSSHVAPRLTFPAHYAPLDIKFSKDGATAYVAFHGSFDKTDPVGYRLSAIAFNAASGEPVARPDSTTALSDIITIPDYTGCPTGCFRPCGMTWDGAGRLWLTSDTTGEIYAIQKSATAPTSTTSGTIVTATSKPNVASNFKVSGGCLAAAAAAFAVMLAL